MLTISTNYIGQLIEVGIFKVSAICTWGILLLQVHGRYKFECNLLSCMHDHSGVQDKILIIVMYKNLNNCVSLSQTINYIL